MKHTNAIFLIFFTLAVPAVWGQKYPRRPAGSAIDASHQPVSLHLRSLRSHSVGATAKALPPAAGVAQCHIDANGVLSGYFLNTATIPSGSTISGAITLLDDNSSIDFTGETLTQSLSPGSFVSLPTITNFGDLFFASGAALDISVQVQTGTRASQVDCEVLVGEAFANSDLVNNEPLISGASLSVASNKDLIMVLNGYFTGDTAQVVMTDLYSSYVVPASAIRLVSNSEVDVDLSQISGLDLTSSDTLNVTLAQDGFSDTVEYRYLPGPAGSFNPSAQ